MKSHEALLKLLNNIGVIGAILAALADIVFVVIMIVGVNIHADMKSIVIFAVVNAMIGILISVLLRYQGQKYAEIENEELCKKFYNKKARRKKKYISMGVWMTLKTIQDIIIKGCTTAFSIFGMIYITIQGSKNPIQLLITLATLVLFACFGLIGMNSAYCRFYNIQVPHMQICVDNIDIEGNNKTDKTNTNAKRKKKPTKSIKDIDRKCMEEESIDSNEKNKGEAELHIPDTIHERHDTEDKEVVEELQEKG